MTVATRSEKTLTFWLAGACLTALALLLPAPSGGQTPSAATPAVTPTSAASPAATPAPTPTPTPTVTVLAPVPPENWVDRTYDWITSRFQRSATNVDSYFAQHEPVDASRESQLRVKVWAYDERSKTGVKPEVTADIPIPNIERRFHIYVDSLSRSVLPDSDPAESERRLRVGSRASLFGGGHYRVTADVGMMFSHGIKLETEVRYRAWWEGSSWQTTFVESVFWNKDDELSELTQLTFDKHLSTAWYLRFQGAGKYTQGQAEWHSALAAKVGFMLDPKRSYLLGMLRMQGIGSLSDEYRAEVTYRARVYRPWLFVEATPLVVFAREKSFKLDRGLRLGIDMFFGGIPEL
jgi:hypothetical protein